MTYSEIIETIVAAVNLLPQENEITDDLMCVATTLEDMWYEELQDEDNEEHK